MSVKTYVAQKGTKFHHDDEFTQIGIEMLDGCSIESAFGGLVSIDGDDLVEFMMHVTVNSKGFRKKYTLAVVGKDG